MTKNEQFVNDRLMSLTSSLMTLLMSRKRVEPIIGSYAFSLLNAIQELLSGVIDSFDRSFNL